jgi:hypothetical protein
MQHSTTAFNKTRQQQQSGNQISQDVPVDKKQMQEHIQTYIDALASTANFSGVQEDFSAAGDIGLQVPPALLPWPSDTHQQNT